MNVAFLGTGILGYPMAERLCLSNKHKVFVYNRTVSKATPLGKLGALVVESASRAVSSGDCVILTLSDYPAIQDVLFGKDAGALKGKTVIQMGTIAPGQSIELQKKIFQQGGEYLECPVLGSKGEAQQAKLILMVGATKEKFEKWKIFLCVFGPDPRFIGEVGKAAAIKLALNQIIASHIAGISLSLGIVEKNGIDPDQFIAILKESSLFAPTFERKLPSFKQRNFENPNFPVKHLLKDVDLIIEEAKDKKLATPVIEAIGKILQQTVRDGLGEKDYAAIFKTINKIK